MQRELVQKIVILGGGTAGWMTAAALSRALNGAVNLVVVESDDIGTVGVGEATIPPILNFNRMLGLDEADFLRQTKGTVKLGIEFVDWGRLGSTYMHAFGRMPSDIQLAPFEHFWLRARSCGDADDLAVYSVTKQAAYAGKFAPPRLDTPDSPLSNIGYAYHFDASLYAKYLRAYSEARCVSRVEGKVVFVGRDATGSHNITHLQLADGREVAGEFFVDCSGFRGRLIEEELNAGYEDWSHWLPCDRAVAVPCSAVAPIAPYTRSSALKAGWQWRIPLQHRTGNGHVFASKFIGEDEATAILLANLDGEVLADPRVLRFTPGIRKASWKGNCVAIGLSSGFLEPLESTSIHLIQSGVSHLLEFLPSKSSSAEEAAEFNRLTRREFEHVRDFVILHYCATTRTDSPLWEYCRRMSIPNSLSAKLRLFHSSGRIVHEPDAVFGHWNWFQVACAQGYMPRSYSAIADVVDRGDLLQYLDGVQRAISECVHQMPTHERFLQSVA